MELAGGEQIEQYLQLQKEINDIIHNEEAYSIYPLYLLENLQIDTISSIDLCS